MLIALLLLVLCSFPAATVAVCDEEKVGTTKKCFQGLNFPEEGSDKVTICKYVETGMQCFEGECCTDARYATAMQHIQEQATASGCTEVTCGSGVSLQMSLVVGYFAVLGVTLPYLF